jgi:ferredoxin
MAHVLLLPAQLRLNLGAGERLLDALDERAEPVLPLACRAMNCGICRLRLLKGADAMRAASARELRLLQQLQAAADERLGCQLVLETDSDDGGTEIVLEINRPR